MGSALLSHPWNKRHAGKNRGLDELFFSPIRLHWQSRAKVQPRLWAHPLREKIILWLFWPGRLEACEKAGVGYNSHINLDAEFSGLTLGNSFLK
jgi:hypothetical protein